MTILNRKLIKEFVKFSAVGATGLVVNLIVLFIFTELVGLFYMVAAIIAFVIALTSNFILNKIWTFEENIRYRTKSRYTKYFIVNVLALLVNLLFLYILTETVGFHYMVSQIISVGLGLSVSFTGSKIWAFN